MRATCYLRVARTNRGYRFSATAKTSAAPLTDTAGVPIKTKLIKLNLELPADLFGPDAVGTVAVAPEHVRHIEVVSE